MITCPDCGQSAPDDARFCEQCGRGLHDLPPPVAALPPLAAGKELQDRFRIVEVISQASQENRYRAEALDDPNRRFMLRERVAPVPQSPQNPETKPEPISAPLPEEDPAGPHSKTQELTPLARTAAAEKPSGSDQSASGGLQELKTEPEHTEAGAQDKAQTQDTGVNGDRSGHGEQAPSTTETSEPAAAVPNVGGSSNGEAEQQPVPPTVERADLGEVFERVLALSQTITHPAYYRALEGFAQDGRVYLAYADEQSKPFGPRRPGATRMLEPEALSAAIQICQAVSYLHNRGMRVNDICPASLAWGAGGRVKLTSLDYVSNDNELQTEPILNDGYTAPEIYRAKQVDKRADLFSIGCVLYTCLTGERIECETWREEAGPIRFYPPHVISPELEKIVRRALAFRPHP
jgi:serine/threonine protein kinase